MNDGALVERPAHTGQRRQAMNDELNAEKKQQIRKSQVRVVVTYFMTAAYVLTSIGLIGWLMWADKSELAIGVFSGVASTTATIIAFWFGSRGTAVEPGRPINTTESGESRT